MRLEVAPLPDRGLVAPEGKRQDLARLREALEALDGDEPVDFGEQRLQVRGGIEVAVGAALGGYDFEDHGDHGDTFSRKVLSSERIKRFSREKAKLAFASGSALSSARYAS